MWFSAFFVVTKRVSLNRTSVAAELPPKTRFFSCAYGVGRCA